MIHVSEISFSASYVTSNSNRGVTYTLSCRTYLGVNIDKHDACQNGKEDETVVSYVPK